MAKYLLLMYGKEMKMPRNPTKAMMEAGVKPWMDYLGPLSKKKVLESSAPVGWNGKMLTAKGGAKSYRAEKVDLVGYMLIKAKSPAEAMKIAKRSPHAVAGMGHTVIRECMDVM
jgi:hypothetical protein